MPLEAGLQELTHYKERLENDTRKSPATKTAWKLLYGESLHARDKLEADYHEILRCNEQTQKQNEEIAMESAALA